MEEHSNGEGDELNLTVETVEEHSHDVHEEDEQPQALENDELTDTVVSDEQTQLAEESGEKKDDVFEVVREEDDAILEETIEDKELDVGEGTEEANGVEEIDWVADEGEEALENDGHRSAEHADVDAVSEEIRWEQDLVDKMMTGEVAEAPQFDVIAIDSLVVDEESLPESTEVEEGHDVMGNGVFYLTGGSISISEDVKDAISEEIDRLLDEDNVSWIKEAEIEIPQIKEMTELDASEEKGFVSSFEDVKDAASSQINGVRDEDNECIKETEIENPHAKELTDIDEIGEKAFVSSSDYLKDAISQKINGVLDENSVSCIKEEEIEIPQIKDLKTEFDPIGEKGFVEEIGKLANSGESEKLQEAIIEKGNSENIVNKSVGYFGNSVKESEVENEIGPNQLTVRISSPSGASWRNCCGILDVLMKSNR